MVGGNMYSIFEMLLKKNGVSVADVSRATGISQSTLSHWKKRNNFLTAKNAKLIADYFGVSVDFLMGAAPDEKVTDEKFEEMMNKQIDAVYYIKPENMKIAQEMFVDKDMQSLFHIKKEMDPARFKAYMDFIKAQFKIEHPEE